MGKAHALSPARQCQCQNGMVALQLTGDVNVLVLVSPQLLGRPLHVCGLMAEIKLVSRRLRTICLEMVAMRGANEMVSRRTFARRDEQIIDELVVYLRIRDKDEVLEKGKGRVSQGHSCDQDAVISTAQ
jgi:hypothetical protein